MWIISLDVKPEQLEKVLERLSDLEDKGLFEIRNVFDEENAELWS